LFGDRRGSLFCIPAQRATPIQPKGRTGAKVASIALAKYTTPIARLLPRLCRASRQRASRNA
jgi:hypothetical protein